MLLRVLSTVLLLASVSLARGEEFRAAWVAAVHNINFPSKAGLGAATQRAEIARICEVARAAGLNALMVQVRPESDALYQSSIEPWSRYLTGTQGKDPGYDPLEVFLAEGRKRGLEIHAWINPYRAAATKSKPMSSSHPAKGALAAHARSLNSTIWFDPTEPAVQNHLVRVVTDIVKRYPVAGVHLDDYFYPYPETYRGDFPDSKAYQRYVAEGGELSKANWRRANVNSMVRRLHQAVKSTRTSAKFGISPFGIYTKGQPSDVVAGLDQLNQLYADPVAWLHKGWVDYMAPQLYWPDGGKQSFSSLLRWWRSPSVNPRQIPIYPGIAIERTGPSHRWAASEIAKQLQLEKTIGPNAGVGFILWDFSPLLTNQKGLRSIVAKY